MEISSPMSGGGESSRRTMPSSSLGRSFRGYSMCILKESCIGISSWITYCSHPRVMSRFVILEFLSWSRIKIIPKPSNVERQLTLLPKFSEEKDTKGSRATFGAQASSSTRCSTAQFHSKRPTWWSCSSRSSTSSALGALQETSLQELLPC